MNRLTELAARLTPAQLKEVEDFAAFLISRQGDPAASSAAPAAGERKITFEGWAGALAHVEPGKSNKQLIREAWDEIAAKHD